MTAATAVSPVASAGFSLPLADSAPAASSHGADGSGKPTCSAKTMANKTGPPWLIRNWVTSFIRLLGRLGESSGVRLACGLVVPSQTVERGQQRDGDHF